MRLKLLSAAESEPLSLLEAAQQLRLADDEAQADQLPDKALIEGIIAAAREAVEHESGCQLLPAVYELVGEALPETVVLPKSPFIRVEGIEYFDGTGQTTLPKEQYSIVEGAEPMVLHLQRPADMLAKANSARIRFAAGYGKEVTDGETTRIVPAVPASAKTAMKLLVTHLYENREAVLVGSTSLIGTELPMGVQFYINPLRVYYRTCE